MVIRTSLSKSQEAALEVTAPVAPPPPEYDEQQDRAWKEALGNLESQIVLYKDAQQGSDPTLTNQQEQRVYDAMNNVADSHTDPQVRAHWKAKAEEFQSADKAGKDNILKDVVKAVATLFAFPFFLTAMFFCATGKALKGIGTVMTTGRLPREKKKDAK